LSFFSFFSFAIFSFLLPFSALLVNGFCQPNQACQKKHLRKHLRLRKRILLVFGSSGGIRRLQGQARQLDKSLGAAACLLLQPAKIWL
jgi:hypothetical protein